jgi:uncharacterized membrane protein
MAIVSTVAWIGMGLGSYQGGYFYDVSGSYVLSYGISAIAGIVNIVIIALLMWYRQHRVARSRSRDASPVDPASAFERP